MKNIHVVLVLAILAAAVLAVTQLSQAAGQRSVHRAALTPSGDVLADRFDDIMVLDGSFANPNLVVETSTLPPGSYVVTAKLTAFAGRRTFARVVCRATLGGAKDTTSTTVGVAQGAAEDQSLSLLLAAPVQGRGGKAQVVCWPEEKSGPLPQVTDASLVAFPVSSIGT